MRSSHSLSTCRIDLPRREHAPTASDTRPLIMSDLAETHSAIDWQEPDQIEASPRQHRAEQEQRHRSAMAATSGA
eukprot:2879612-Rhodomonas_salina.1